MHPLSLRPLACTPSLPPFLISPPLAFHRSHHKSDQILFKTNLLFERAARTHSVRTAAVLSAIFSVSLNNRLPAPSLSSIHPFVHSSLRSFARSLVRRHVYVSAHLLAC